MKIQFKFSTMNFTCISLMMVNTCKCSNIFGFFKKKIYIYIEREIYNIYFYVFSNSKNNTQIKWRLNPICYGFTSRQPKFINCTNCTHCKHTTQKLFLVYFRCCFVSNLCGFFFPSSVSQSFLTDAQLGASWALRQ